MQRGECVLTAVGEFYAEEGAWWFLLVVVQKSLHSCAKAVIWSSASPAGAQSQGIRVHVCKVSVQMFSHVTSYIENVESAI